MAVDFNIIRSRLVQEQKRLNEELEQLNASHRSITIERREGSPYGKREEEANGAADLEKRLALESRIRDTLVQVEHALQKLDEGTYELCDSCGQRIDRARLEALPQAAHCVNCKVLQEGRGNRNGRLSCQTLKGGKHTWARLDTQLQVYVEKATVVTVTKRAKDMLKRMLIARGAGPEEVPRLYPIPDGSYAVSISTEMSGDQLMEHDWYRVLLVGIEYFRMLDGAVVDCRATVSGPVMFVKMDPTKKKYGTGRERWDLI